MINALSLGLALSTEYSAITIKYLKPKVWNEKVDVLFDFFIYI